MTTTKSARPRLAERNRAQRIEAVRQEIVDAAIAEFTDRGYHDTSMAQIAKRLGTGASTVYNYFTSKQEILEHAVEDTVTTLAQLLTASTFGTAATIEEFRASANRLGDRVADILVEDPSRIRMLLVIAGSSEPALREAWTGFCRLATGVIEEFLTRGVADGFLRAGLHPAATAHAIVAIPVGMLVCDPTIDLSGEQSPARVRATVALITSGIFADRERYTGQPSDSARDSA